MLKRQITLILAVMAAMLLLSSCTDSSEGGPIGPTERRVTVSPPAANVGISDTITFSAVGGTGGYYWDVSQPTVGTISSAGVFTPTQSGEATIYCTDSQGLLGLSHVTVNPSTVIITPVAATIGYSDTLTLTAAGGVTNSYYWWLNPLSIFGTITQAGTFTSKDLDGTVTVTATDDYGNTGSAIIMIRGIPIIISPSSITLEAGNTITFTASGGSESFAWASSNIAVGTITQAGAFTALTTGTTTITATDTDGNSKTASVTVGAGGAAGALIIIPGAASLNKSEVYQFNANGGQAAYSWTSSDPTVGTIDSNGLLTAGTTAGTTTLTVTDSLGTTSTAAVTVVASSITASPATATISIGSTLTIVGTGGAGAYFWSSNDASIATVAAQGTPIASTTVTGIDIGTVTINITDISGNVGTAAITVSAPTLVSISPATTTIAVGTNISMIATGGIGTYWWSSLNDSIATVPVQMEAVSMTTLTAVGIGTTDVEAIDNDGSSDTATITVVAATPVVISPATATLTAGSTLTAVATGGAGTYMWSSGNAGSVTVEVHADPVATMTLTAIATGTAIIYAIDENGNQGTATITVP